MWNNVSTFFSTFFDTVFPLRRQKQVTFAILITIVAFGILLLVLIGWSDLFYA